MEDESEEQDVRRSKRAKAFDGQPINITDASESDHELEANRRRKPNQAAKASVYEEQNIVNQKRGKAFHGQTSDGFQSDVADHELEVNRLQKLNRKAGVGFDDEDMMDDKIADKSMADADHNNDNQHYLVSVQQEHPQVEAEGSSVDIISTLPSTIIDTILCFVPIKDAVRTSKLSRNWRYNWVTIPKLVFHWRDMRDKTTYELLDAAHQVLLRHQGPILEFGLTMWNAVDMGVEIDKVISHLVRNSNTLKKLTVNILIPSEEYDSSTPLYVLPLPVFSLHQLRDLYAKDCTFIYHPTSSGFRSLTSLYMESNNMITISKEALLRFFSNCPLLKQLELVLGNEGIDEAITIIELSKCLPVIEHLSFYRWTVECSAQYSVRQKLPTALVHLKYFCLNMMNLFDDYGLRFVCLLMRNSPNLEKLKLELVDDQFREEDIKFVTLEDCGDIWLEHLKEFEIVHFLNAVGEMEFVQLILAKSPVLKNLIVGVYQYVADEQAFEIIKIVQNSPRASPLAKIMVERRPLFYGSSGVNDF